MNKEIIIKATAFCNEIFADKKNYELPDVYYYKHLPLCVIDSIFSIGVKYEAVQNTLNRFCEHFKIDKFSNSEEFTTSDFLKLMKGQPIKELTENIYHIHQVDWLCDSHFAYVFSSSQIPLFAFVERFFRYL